MNNEFKDYYRILGVTPDATLSSIQKARERELSQNWSNPIGRLQVEEAYSVLSSFESRRRYDQMFNEQVTERQRAMMNATNYSEFASALSNDSNISNITQPQVEEMEESIEEPTNEIEEPKEEIEEPLEEIEEPVADQPQVAEQPQEVEQPQVAQTQPQENIIPIQFKETSKLKTAAICAAGAAIAGPVGIIIAYAALKISKKYKLHKNKKPKLVKFQTGESKLLEEYRKNLDTQINELLARPHNNYNLEIARLRYENQVGLVKKRMEFKADQHPKRGGFLKYKLECVALKEQLKRAESNLKIVNDKIEKYNSNDIKNKILYNANVDLYSKQKEIDAKKNPISKEKLQIKQNRIWNKRDKAAIRLKTTRNFVGKVQDGAIKAYDVTKSVVQNVFKSYEDVDMLFKFDSKDPKERSR